MIDYINFCCIICHKQVKRYKIFNGHESTHYIKKQSLRDRGLKTHEVIDINDIILAQVIASRGIQSTWVEAGP
jgi:sulfur relay (sulfurtransferase) DsrF/TusC family protein